MAENKKSFVLYVDQKDVFNELTDIDAGQLIKHIFSYVSDENPTTENPFVKISFILIKSQLKRDLKKYEEKTKQWSDAGKASAEKKRLLKELNERSTESTNVETVATESTVNDIVNVTDNVNDNVIVKDKKEKKEKTKVFTPPTIFEVKEYFKENGYSETSAQKAFNHYDCADWIDTHGNKVRSWKQKMQTVWFKEENKIKEVEQQPISKTLNLYLIPNNDLFGYDQNTLYKMCLDGKYPKR